MASRRGQGDSRWEAAVGEGRGRGPWERAGGPPLTLLSPRNLSSQAGGPGLVLGPLTPRPLPPAQCNTLHLPPHWTTSSQRAEALAVLSLIPSLSPSPLPSPTSHPLAQRIRMLPICQVMSFTRAGMSCQLGRSLCQTQSPALPRSSITICCTELKSTHSLIHQTLMCRPLGTQS